jgi:hypothetical protein
MLKGQREALLSVLACALYGAGGRPAADTNLLVAANGGGWFKSVQKADMAVPAGCATNQQ